MSDPFVDIPITGFDPAFLPTSVLEAELVASAASAQRALTHRRLQVLVVFNGRAVWIARGFASCAAWWAVIAHIKLSTARDHIRVARALHKFESLDRALAEQTLSYAKIRCLVPHAHANNVADLATLARHTPTGRLSATLAAYRNAQLTCAQMGSTDTTLAAPLATLPPLTYSCAQPIVNYMTRAVTTRQIQPFGSSSIKLWTRSTRTSSMNFVRCSITRRRGATSSSSRTLGDSTRARLPSCSASLDRPTASGLLVVPRLRKPWCSLISRRLASYSFGISSGLGYRPSCDDRRPRSVDRH